MVACGLVVVTNVSHRVPARRPLAQGALLVLDTQNRAVLVVLVGQRVNAHNTVTHGKAVMRLAFARLPRPGGRR